MSEQQNPAATMYWPCERGAPDPKGPWTVLFAAHDDGGGAFGSLLALAKAMWKTVAGAEQNELFFLFVNKSSGERGRGELREAFSGHACYLDTDNLIALPKDELVAGVRPEHLPAVVQKAAHGMDHWGTAFHWQSADRPDGTEVSRWQDIDLAISMGVPWVHREARTAGIPSIEVGDMCWSLVLGGCLEMANRLTPFAQHVLARIAACELLATEAWLLPFAAPSDYVKHFASGGVPVTWLPGVFRGADLDKNEVGLLTEQLGNAAPGRTPVGLGAGRTKVWDGTLDNLASQPGSKKYAMFAVHKGQLRVLESGGSPLKTPPDGIVLRAAVDLLLTRGGIAALDCVAVHTPVAVTEEPFHWLSARQRESLAAAGLCIPVPLQALSQSPAALIEDLLGGRRTEVENVRARTYGIQNGAEWHLARYLLKRLGIPFSPAT